MATKRYRGKRWHYTVRRKSLLPQPIYLSFEDEAEGDRYVARLEALLDKGHVPEGFAEKRKDRILTVRDAIIRYTRGNPALKDRDVIRVLESRWGEVRLDELTYSWCEGWIRAMQAVDRLSPSRIRKFKGSLQRCLTWIQAHHPDALPAGNPLALLPKGYSAHADRDDVERDRRLEPEEEEAIRAVLAGKRPELTLMFELALETGMRMREIYTLTWDQIDIPRLTVFLDKTKNGDKRQVPLSSVAARVLEQAGPGDGPVFPWSGPPARVTSRLSTRWGRIFEAAGCPDLRFHDLRHEATSRLFERTDLSDIEIAKITGHRNPRMLMRYANLRGSALAGRLW